jgi:RNA polymerase sigma-70 factor (ECF subfamily)
VQSDDDLMARCARGDATAFEEVFARHEELVRRCVSSIVRDPTAADDLVQEAFLRVWTHGEQWASRGTVKAWIRRIATNLALNYVRSVRRRRQEPLNLPPHSGEEEGDWPAPGWLVDATALGPDAVLELAERQARFAELIDRLPPGKREVFRMAREAEMDIREVADALGIPEGTVKSRLHYATRWLARNWKQIEED